MQDPPKPVFNLPYFKGFPPSAPGGPSHDITRCSHPGAAGAATGAKKEVTADSLASDISYAERHDAHFYHWRELELLNHIFTHVNVASFKNNPEAIIAEMDAFMARNHLTNIGEVKGRLVKNLITTHYPRAIIEVGAYIGYSTLHFASALKSNLLIPTAEKKYIAVEESPLFASIALSLVNLAGLLDLVQVTVGRSPDSLRNLKSQVPRVDVLFLAGNKPLHTDDLKIVEEMGIIGVGSLVVADNVMKAGYRRYVRYVRMGVGQKLLAAEKVRIAEEEGRADVGEWEKGGDPSLVYESGVLRSSIPTGIPDAIEVTMCIGRVDEDE